MNHRNIQGIVPPVITVFDSNGEIDEEKTSVFIQHLIGKGVHCIFVGGSTGEASLMTIEQRRKIIDIGVKAAQNKVPTMVGTGHNSTRITIELSKYAENAGADIVVASLPHYPKPSQEAIYEHYKSIAKQISIPLWVYNWPTQYGVDIEPETVAHLAEAGYIQGIKDSHPNIDHTADIIRQTQGKISVFEGFEAKILPALCLGAAGSICTISNIIPSEVVAIYDYFVNGELEKAQEKQLSILGLANVLYARNDAQLLKEGLKMLGFDVGDALMPTTGISPELYYKLETELKKLCVAP